MISGLSPDRYGAQLELLGLIRSKYFLSSMARSRLVPIHTYDDFLPSFCGYVSCTLRLIETNSEAIF